MQLNLDAVDSRYVNVENDLEAAAVSTCCEVCNNQEISD